MRRSTIAFSLAVCVLVGSASFAEPEDPSEPAAGAGGTAPLSASPTDAGGLPDPSVEEAAREAESAEAAVAANPNPAPMTGAYKLSLAEAYALGLENNLRLVLERYDPEIAGYDYTAAWGQYEPTLGADFLHSSVEQPSASVLESGVVAGAVPRASNTTRTNDGGIGIDGLIPRLGWQYGVRYNGDRNTSTNSIFFSLDPQYTAEFSATATLPLARGFLYGQPWIRVKTTQLGQGIAFQNFRASIMDTIQQIEEAYWDLASRKLDQGVAQKSLETAQALLRQVEAQYEVGVVSKVDVIEAEAGLADREFRLITADNVYSRSQDKLVDLVLGTGLRPGSKIEIELTDSPETYRDFSVDEEVAIGRAYELRPELEVARRRIDQQDLQVKQARNERLPQVDVIAGYGYNGLAGSARPGLTTTRGRDLQDASEDFFSAKGDNFWRAGVNLSIPIGNTTARSNYQREKLELRRAEVSLVQSEQEIVVTVRDRVRTLAAAIEGIEAAERGLAAAKEQLRAEEIRLQHGESTPFDVLQRVEALVLSESQRIGALQTYHNSVVALDRAQGTILRDRNIVVEEALPMR
jgi:outer membrane protein TolC